MQRDRDNSFIPKTQKQDDSWKETCWENKLFKIKPLPYVYAALNAHVSETDVRVGDSFILSVSQLDFTHELPEWIIKETIKIKGGDDYARLYINHRDKQIVLAYHHKEPSEKNIFQEIESIQAFLIDDKSFIIETLNRLLTINEEYDYHISCTGYGLGAIYTYYALLQATLGQFKLNYLPIVLFDSPGMPEAVAYMLKSNGIERADLDCANFLSAPNIKNCTNVHLGRVSRLMDCKDISPKYFEKFENKIRPLKQLILQKKSIDVALQDSSIKNLMSKTASVVVESIYDINSYNIYDMLNTFDAQTGYPNNYKSVFDWPVLDADKKIIYTYPGESLINFIADGFSIILKNDINSNDFWEALDSYIKTSSSYPEKKDDIKYKASYEAGDYDNSRIRKTHLDPDFTGVLHNYYDKNGLDYFFYYHKLERHPFIEEFEICISHSHSSKNLFIDENKFFELSWNSEVSIEDFFNSIKNWLNHQDPHLMYLDEHDELEKLLISYKKREKLALNILDNSQDPNLKNFIITKKNDLFGNSWNTWELQINPNCQDKSCHCSAWSFLIHFKKLVYQFPQLPFLSTTDTEQFIDSGIPILLQYLSLEDLKFIPSTPKNLSPSIKTIYELNQIIADWSINREYINWIRSDTYPLINKVEAWVSHYMNINYWIQQLPYVLKTQWLKLYGDDFYYKRWLIEAKILITAITKQKRPILTKEIIQSIRSILSIFPVDYREHAQEAINRFLNDKIQVGSLFVEEHNQSSIIPFKVREKSAISLDKLHELYSSANLEFYEEENDDSTIGIRERRYAHRILKLIAESAQQATDALGPAPCPFTLVSLNTAPKFTLTPNSKLQLSILVPDVRSLQILQNTNYLKTWIRFIRTQIQYWSEDTNGERFDILIDEEVDFGLGTPTQWASRMLPNDNEQELVERYAYLSHNIPIPIYYLNEDLTVNYRNALKKEFESIAYHFASSYAKDSNSKKDIVKATIWYKRAALAGNDDASTEFEKLFPEAFRQLIERVKLNDPTLQALDLNDWPLTDDHLYQLTEALQKNTNLHTLQLKNNKITIEGIYHITSLLNQNKTIQRIDLSGNSVGEKGLRIIDGVIEPILQHRRDETVTCKAVDLHECPVEIIRDTFLTNLAYYTRLVSLNLSHLDQKKGFFIPALTNFFHHGCILQALDLSYNQLPGNILDELSGEMGNNRTLAHINLSNNQITANLDDLEDWNRIFGQNPAMKVINISHNFLEEECEPSLNDPNVDNDEQKSSLNNKSSLFYSANEGAVIHSLLKPNMTLSATGSQAWVVALVCKRNRGLLDPGHAMVLLEFVRESGQRGLFCGHITRKGRPLFDTTKTNCRMYDTDTFKRDDYYVNAHPISNGSGAGLMRRIKKEKEKKASYLYGSAPTKTSVCTDASSSKQTRVNCTTWCVWHMQKAGVDIDVSIIPKWAANVDEPEKKSFWQRIGLTK